MLDFKQYKNYILCPVLADLNLLNESSVMLMLGTLAVESDFGRYLHQVKGYAKGIYQIEPKTLFDINENMIKYVPKFRNVVSKYKIYTISDENNLIGNLYYTTIIARLIYYRFKEPLPKYDDIKGLAKYWKEYYNTHLGKGTEKDFIKKFKKYVGHIWD